MKVILDVTRLMRLVIKHRTLKGIDRVTFAYVMHDKHKAHALIRWCGRSWILPAATSRELFEWLTSPHPLSLQGRWLIIRGIFAKKKPDELKHSVLINTGHICPNHKDYLRLIRQYQVKPVFFIHDLIPMIYPEYCAPDEDKKYQKKLAYVFSIAQGIITNSQATLDDLRHYAQNIHQALPPCIVALLASGILAKKPRPQRPMQKAYFVVLSTIEARKNHLLLLQIWRKFYQNLGAEAPHLVVIGHRGWEAEGALDILDRSQEIHSVVSEISNCADEDVATYLYHSQALLFPSFTEGYGLPLIEALSLGIPVIASDLGVFREIAADIPEYLDPLDGIAWKNMILDYAKPHGELRQAQLQRLKTFAAPDWAPHFKQLERFLAKIAQDAPNE